MAAPTEEFMPVLSAGRHRNARRGACFMEYASYLAGERWSDHPACTYPTLASLARLVNDLISDTARPRLTTYIPSVVGLNGTDPRLPIIISALAASAAIPVANQSRQRALATALVRCEQLLAHYDGPSVDRARQRIRVAFDQAPGSEQWARAFMDDARLVVPRPILPGDEAILRTVVIGIADACVANADARLERLLAAAIEETAALLAPHEAEIAVSPEREAVLV